ncbi:MAG TPA: DUF2141 domain-containing protein [Mucilaginibacter sp.]|jgi:uncharacterized protein (DUF2141 family)
MKRRLIFTLLLLSPFKFQGISAAKFLTSAGTLTVVISNFRNDRGNAALALYNQEKGFPKSPDKALKLSFVSINNKKATAVFENLPAGEYAVAVFHDENNNKKMDTNFLGIPKEGVGASNNARGHFGPPKYQDAKFNFNGSTQTIYIAITYL